MLLLLPNTVQLAAAAQQPREGVSQDAKGIRQLQTAVYVLPGCCCAVCQPAGGPRGMHDNATTAIQGEHLPICDWNAMLIVKPRACVI